MYVIKVQFLISNLTNHIQLFNKMKKNRTIPLTLLLSALATTTAGASAMPGASAAAT